MFSRGVVIYLFVYDGSVAGSAFMVGSSNTIYHNRPNPTNRNAHLPWLWLVHLPLLSTSAWLMVDLVDENHNPPSTLVMVEPWLLDGNQICQVLPTL